MRSATKFPLVFLHQKQNYFLLAIVKIKTNLKAASAVYCALPPNIIKYMSFEYICTFILYYIYIQHIHLISVTLLQIDQNGNQNAFGQTSPLPLPLIRIRTLSIDPNLKMSTDLFALYKIEMMHKESNLRSKGARLIPPSSGPSTATSNVSFSLHFLQFFVLLKVKS